MTDDGSRITTDHLARAACVYVRQSSSDQVRHNLESQQLQYALQTRARDLGWHAVETIDEDLGRSGTGSVVRPGFQKLLTAVAVCEGRVGIVLSVDASRLARNGREWHTLLEFCAVVGCLLGDANSVYDRVGRIEQDPQLVTVQRFDHRFIAALHWNRMHLAREVETGRYVVLEVAEE